MGRKGNNKSTIINGKTTNNESGEEDENRTKRTNRCVRESARAGSRDVAGDHAGAARGIQHEERVAHRGVHRLARHGAVGDAEEVP